MLNKTKGNMYEWVDFTWNTVKGKCPHGCHYCYMKKWGEQAELHFDEKELKTNLGNGNFIFVGSSCDMFANEIPNKWIVKTLHRCRLFNNKYLFQSKNPERFCITDMPRNSILGTTIESNREYEAMGNAPDVMKRAIAMMNLSNVGFKTIVTIEPIMDFDVPYMALLINLCNPIWVNIGANTNTKVKLQEPSSEKVSELISLLNKKIEVKIKSNLKRILGVL